MAKTLPLSEVKTHLPSLIAEIEGREEEVVVTRNGRPAAVLVNFDELARLKATLDVLGDRHLMRQIRKSRQFLARGRRGKSFEEVFAEPLKQPGKRRPRR
jgi:prevent-host-death family protein